MLLSANRNVTAKRLNADAPNEITCVGGLLSAYLKTML